MLARLWTAAGKPIDTERLQVYRETLKIVPIALLERAVDKLIREMKYPSVPIPSAIWEMVKKELGNPWDVEMAIEDWIERRLKRAMIWVGSDEWKRRF